MKMFRGQVIAGRASRQKAKCGMKRIETINAGGGIMVDLVLSDLTTPISGSEGQVNDAPKPGKPARPTKPGKPRLAKKPRPGGATRSRRQAAISAPTPTAPAPQPAPTGGLDERAMLVRLSIGFWEGRKKDKTKTDEVVKDERALPDAGTWWTRLISVADTNPINTASAQARAAHARFTLPWYDDGVRVLPAAMFLQYTAEMRKYETAFRASVDTFLNAYPRLVENAATRLGGLFNPAHYPTPKTLAEKFSWVIRFTPLPNENDFRVNLDKATTEQIKKGIAEEGAKAMETAMGDLWERLHGAVARIADRLGDPEGIFRDTLIKNVVEICEILPRMNVTGNPELEAARAAVMAKLAKQEPETLRVNKAVRADAAKDAAAILAKMEAFMGKRA